MLRRVQSLNDLMASVLVVLTILLALGTGVRFLGAMFKYGQVATEPPKTTPTEVAHLLAKWDGQDPQRTGHFYLQLLSNLDDKCVENHELVAGMMSTIGKKTAEYGERLTVVQVAQELDYAIESSIQSGVNRGYPAVCLTAVTRYLSELKDTYQ